MKGVISIPKEVTKLDEVIFNGNNADEAEVLMPSGIQGLNACRVVDYTGVFCVLYDGTREE